MKVEIVVMVAVVVTLFGEKYPCGDTSQAELSPDTFQGLPDSF